MATERVRWRNVRELLDDLPKVHCTVKPSHEFCTVCMRINYRVAQDCPLFHQRPKRKLRPLPDHWRDHHEPLKDHLTADDVKHILKGEDFPIIEFAGPRGTGKGGPHGGDEEVLEVEPIEVKPIKEDASKPRKPSKTPPGLKAKDEEKPSSPPHKPDPEELVQEIMEELEFPEGPNMEEDEDVDGDEDVDEDETSVEKGSEKEPPRVEKQVVRKRKPIGSK